MKYSTFEIEAAFYPNSEVRKENDEKISWHAFQMSTEKEMFNNHLPDTYNLIRIYARYATLEHELEFELNSFKEYCKKYGSPLGSCKFNLISIEDFKIAFSQLNTILNWEKSLTIDEICTPLSASIQSYYNNYLTNLMYAVLRYDKNQIDNEIVWDVLNKIPTKEIMFPSFQISINKPIDLPILNDKSKKIKSEWLKRKLLENCSGLMNQYFYGFSIEIQNGFPVTKALILNHLTVFLFKMLTGEIKFNICPYCKKIPPNGKKYCNRQHMDLYRRTVPEYKLADIISKWRTRSNKYDMVFYDELLEEGRKMLDEQEYKDVLKYLQKKRKDFEFG